MGLAGVGAERRAAGGTLLQPSVWYHGCTPWPGLQRRQWWLECLQHRKSSENKDGETGLEPGCPSRCYLSPRQRWTHSNNTTGSHDQWEQESRSSWYGSTVTCFEQGQTVAPGPSSPQSHTSRHHRPKFSLGHVHAGQA